MKPDLEFVKQVAKDQGREISDKEAEKAWEIVKARSSKEDFYYNMKEYFQN